MADPSRLATKYECQDESPPESSHLNDESDSSVFLSKQSDEFTMLFLLMQQAYSDGEWLTSMKFVSLLMDHVNKSLLDRNRVEISGTSSSGNQTDLHRVNHGDDHHCTNHTLSNDPVNRTDDESVGAYTYAQSVIVFKTELSVLVKEIISHIRTNECLQEYTFSVVEEILDPIRRAYHSNMDVMLSLTHLLFSLDIKDQALQFAHEVVQTFPESAVALETFENICCHVVDRWHFKMLNDIMRNKTFECAIKDVLLHHGQEKTVCDIGSGTGLLSFISAKYAHRVYAVETSSLMCHIAKDVQEAKDFDTDPAGKIQVINEMSTNLQVPKNFPNRVDVLVTETFDAGLFGEGIISTLSHAWRELLVGAEGKHQAAEAKASNVIPQKAKVFVEAISSQDISQESSFHHGGNWHDIDLSSVSIVSMTSMVQSDPYSSCHLKDLPHGYKSLSDVHPLIKVNFNDPKEIFDMEKGLSGLFDLNIKEEGSLDAFVVWFQLFLTESISLSTHPGSEGCWEQAVFPVRSLALSRSKISDGRKSNIPIVVSKGDKVTATYCLEENRLSLHEVDVVKKDKPPAGQDVTVHTPTSQCPHKLMTDPAEWWSQSIFCLSEWEILLLNNAAYHDGLLQYATRWMDVHKTSASCVIDTHPGFSPLCLQLLHHGCSEVLMMEQHQTHKALACKLAHINNLDMRKINFFQDISELMEFEFLTSTPAVQECSPISKAALALCEVVDYQGRLAENLESNFEYMRYALSNFSSRQVLPQKVDIYGVFVESDRLRNDSYIVSDEKTLGFPIGRFLNEFSVTNHPGISLSTLPHKKLTDPFKIFSLDLESILNILDCKNEQQRCDNVPDTSLPNDSVLHEQSVESASGCRVDKDNRESHECSPFDQCVDLKVPVKNDGKLSAMVYWFDIQLSSSQHIFTNDTSLHWKQAAVMLKNEIETFKGKELSVNIRLKNSNLKVKL